MRSLIIRFLRVGLQIAHPCQTLFILLSLFFPALASAVTHTASGTSTWNATTGVLTINWTSSDFTCKGPVIGTQTFTGVTITATTMTMPSDGSIWTRPSGTAGNGAGTWTYTDSTTGNSYMLTITAGAVNTSGTLSLTGNIVGCGIYGNQNPSAYSQHWSDGYYVDLEYYDPSRTATAVSVTGPGITGSEALTYNAVFGSWNSWTSPSAQIFFGPSYPALPYTYTFTITPSTGTPATATSSVSCVQPQLPTSPSPTGTVSGTPTFSWTGISDTSAVYGLELHDNTGNQIWYNYNISGTSIVYSGPPLTSGATYYYYVSVQSSGACSNGQSLTYGSFTYGGGGVPVIVPTALDNWYGQWTSSYSGGDSGSCSITISLSTTTQAALSGSCISDSNPQLQNLVSGQVTLNGAMTLTAGTSSTGAQFSGILQGTSGSGQWVNPLYGISGTWTMSQLTAPTTAIVGSGLWNLARLDPACNYTDLGRANVSYANGAYSATVNFSGHHMGPDCQDRGPESCTKTGVFSAAQDLLTTSQFQTMFQAFASSCGDDGSMQSVSFTSPDSVSLSETFPSGYYINVQMNRAAPTPASYTLAVTNAGTGTITSSPAGIDCGSTCSGSLSSGATVTLTATPASGNYFVGWSGDCAGTGSCSVTMSAARNVTATFRPVPFTASLATSSVITATSATISTRITFNPPDVGKRGAVFVTAMAPSGSLAVERMAMNASSASRAMVRTSSASSSFVLMQLTPSGWQQVVNGQLIPYASGVLGDQLAAQNILNSTDTSNLKGAQFCLGYGTSAAEMNATGRMLPVATIPDPNSTATAVQSCVVSNVDIRTYVPAASASGGYMSYLRVINVGNAAAPVSVALIDGSTGVIGSSGQLTASLPAQAAITYTAQQVEAALGVTLSASDRSRIRVIANTPIEVQSFLLQPGGVFNEISDALGGASAITVRNYVPAAMASSGYVSYLRVVNTGTAATPVTVAKIDPATGQTGAAGILNASLPAGAAITYSATQIEAALGSPIAASERPRIQVSGANSLLDVQTFLLQPNAAFTNHSSGQTGTTIDVRNYVPAAMNGYMSYLRVINDGSVAAPVTAALIDDVTGVAGSPAVLISSLPAAAAVTLAPSQVEAALGGSIAATARPRIRISSSVMLAVQSFLLQPGGAFNEMSNASSGTSVDVRAYIPAADASSGYTSYLRVINTGTVATPVTVALVDGVTGTAGSPRILISSLPAGGASTLTPSQVEAALGTAVAPGSRPRIRITGSTVLEVQSYLTQPGGAFTEISGGQSGPN